MLETLTLVVLPAVVLWLSWMKYRGLEYVLVNYRWVFVVFFIIPVSLAYDLFFYARSWLIFRMNSAPDKHDEKVQHVQQQVCGCGVYGIACKNGELHGMGPGEWGEVASRIFKMKFLLENDTDDLGQFCLAVIQEVVQFPVVLGLHCFSAAINEKHCTGTPTTLDPYLSRSSEECQAFS